MVRAYVYSRRGKPSDTLELQENYDVPSLKQDQIRVKVAAVGLNPVDWKLMKYLPTFIGKRPAIAASDYSGTVMESNSDLFKPGDEVYGIVHSSVKIATGLGSLAEQIVAPASACARRPERLDIVPAAGISLVGLTAVVLARHADASAERASAGQRQRRVLVCGGASSVGMSLVSILHDRGYHVSATCSQSNASLVRRRGADVTFDYRQAGMTDKLIKHVHVNGTFDAILDCADAFDVWQTSDKTLNSCGSYTNVGMDLTQGVVPALRKLVSYFLRPAWLGGVPRAYSRPKDIATRQNMDELSDFIDRGVIEPIVDSQYDFDKAVDAFERLMSNQATGKVIIRL